MSIYESLPKANSQNVRLVKANAAEIARREGPSRWVLPGIVLGLIVALIILCGLTSIVCDLQTDPLRIVCPPAGTATTPAPLPTTVTPAYTPTPTDTPATTAPSTDTPTPTNTPVPLPCTTLTPRPANATAAVDLATRLSEEFRARYGPRFNPQGAVPFNTICLGTDSDQLLGMLVPAVDEYQTYKGREVEGIFYFNDSRLAVEILILLNKTNVQYSTLPFGAFMLACNHQRPDDCLAVSLDGQEYQIRPDRVEITNDLAYTSPPRVAYELGSYRKCFYVGRRKICIRVF